MASDRSLQARLWVDTRAVFTFNLLTIEADELIYDQTEHMVTARGNVSWQDGKTSDSAPQLRVKLNG